MVKRAGFVVIGIAGITSAIGTARAQTPVTSPTPATGPAPAALTLATGVPLHVRVDKTVRIAVGSGVTGTLTENIYATDRILLPTGTKLRGTIAATEPVHGLVRTQALLNGDVTPLHTPVVHFVAMTLPDGRSFPLLADARLRETTMVNFVPTARKPSLYAQGKAIVVERIQSTRDEIFAPGKRDRIIRLFYSQLPFHPQNIWAGQQLIAELTTPVAIPVANAAPLPLSGNDTSLDGKDLTARLTTALDSNTTRKGETVSAVVTEPVFAADGTVLIAEGTTLEGTVLSSKPARSFGRNGELHFAVRSVQRAGLEAQHVQGTVAGAEGAQGANVTVDREGNVKTNAPKDNFVAPLLLVALAAHASDNDHHHDGGTGGGLGNQTVGANGFGLIARVLALGVQNTNVSTGFGAYGAAKSITFRYLLRGKNVTFPKDTLVKVRLSTRVQ